MKIKLCTECIYRRIRIDKTNKDALYCFFDTKRFITHDKDVVREGVAYRAPRWCPYLKSKISRYQYINK